MGRIQINVSDWEADEIIHALEMDINEDYPMTDPFNHSIQLIINRIKNAKDKQND